METAYYNLAGAKISDHDCKIISLVLKGNLRKNICTVLDITDNTLDTEMRILYAKLQIHDKIQLFKLATHNGFSDEGSYTNLPLWKENEQTQSSTAHKIKRKKPRPRKPRDKRNELF
jgi:DNA-binding CsgD family transcriptional regulator